MQGVVNLDKPVGPTSHDMVSLLRRLTGTRRIGHAGTLDPLASGVLPILVGTATRFSEELTAGHKRYEATVRLGFRSETDDAEGPLVPGRFVGTFAQRPPAYSARKLGGRAAYRSARAGAALDLPPREVTIESLVVRDVRRGAGWTDVEVDLRCGPGTYVRSLARDVGDLLGCGGYLFALRRTEAAGLRVDAAISPERLGELAERGRLEVAVTPVLDLLPFPRLGLDAVQASLFLHGARFRVDDLADGRYAIVADGALLGTAIASSSVLRPHKVLAAGAGAARAAARV
ncbi:MAG TPA: tRNA pseudouridine(55) synthase TruB [Candidatus Limnocylindria bacterium]|nr:tRNA pseudouridine(55) synthase TruB [Candidatus Limnocylindria bacterium]